MGHIRAVGESMQIRVATLLSCLGPLASMCTFACDGSASSPAKADRDGEGGHEEVPGPAAHDSGGHDADGEGDNARLVGVLDILSEADGVVCALTVDLVAEASTDCPDCEFQLWLEGVVVSDASDPGCVLPPGIDFPANDGRFALQLAHDSYRLDRGDEGTTYISERDVLSIGPVGLSTLGWFELWDEGYRSWTDGEDSEHEVIEHPDASFEWSADGLELHRSTSADVLELWSPRCAPQSTAVEADVPVAPTLVGEHTLWCGSGNARTDVWEVRMPADAEATFWVDNLEEHVHVSPEMAVTGSDGCVANAFAGAHACTPANAFNNQCPAATVISDEPETIWVQVADGGCLGDVDSDTVGYGLWVEGIDPARVQLLYADVDVDVPSSFTATREVSLTLSRESR